MSYLLVIIKKYIPGSIVYFVLFHLENLEFSFENSWLPWSNI